MTQNIEKDINTLELSAILYYADFLSLRDISLPVTDSCKYFYIYGVPFNSNFLIDKIPIFDNNNKYYQQALSIYSVIRNKFGEEGLASFIDDICSIRACGMVDGIRMLNYIHQYSNKKDKTKALETYNQYMNNLRYEIQKINEDGETERQQQSKYVYHAEQNNKLHN